MHIAKLNGITEIIKMDPKEALKHGKEGEKFGFKYSNCFVTVPKESAEDAMKEYEERYSEHEIVYAQWGTYDENDELLLRRIYTLLPEEELLEKLRGSYIGHTKRMQIFEEAAGVTLPGFFYENTEKAWKARRGYLRHFDAGRADNTDNEWDREDLECVMEQMMHEVKYMFKKVFKKSKKAA